MVLQLLISLVVDSFAFGFWQWARLSAGLLLAGRTEMATTRRAIVLTAICWSANVRRRRVILSAASGSSEDFA